MNQQLLEALTLLVYLVTAVIALGLAEIAVSMICLITNLRYLRLQNHEKENAMIEMRWIHHSGAETFDDFNKETIVMIKHASKPNFYFPLTLQYRTILHDAEGDIYTEWVGVPIVKEGLK